MSTGWPQSELVVDAQPQLAPAPVTGPPPVPRIWERSSGSLSLLMAPAAAAVEAPPPEVEEIEDTLQETQQEDRQPSVSVFDDMFDDCPELRQQLLQQQAVGAVDGVETAIKRLRLRGKQPSSAFLIPRHRPRRRSHRWRRLVPAGSWPLDEDGSSDLREMTEGHGCSH